MKTVKILKDVMIMLPGNIRPSYILKDSVVKVTDEDAASLIKGKDASLVRTRVHKTNAPENKESKAELENK